MEGGTFVSQSKYAKNLVKKFGLESAKQIPMAKTKNPGQPKRMEESDPAPSNAPPAALILLPAAATASNPGDSSLSQRKGVAATTLIGPSSCTRAQQASLKKELRTKRSHDRPIPPTKKLKLNPPLAFSSFEEEEPMEVPSDDSETKSLSIPSEKVLLEDFGVSSDNEETDLDLEPPLTKFTLARPRASSAAKAIAAAKGKQPMQSSSLGNISPSQAVNSRFYYRDNQRDWNIYATRKFESERNYDIHAHRVCGIVKFVQYHQWDNTLTNFEGYVESIVKEFYANLTNDLLDENSKFFCKVYVRGHWFSFTVKEISRALQLPEGVSSVVMSMDHHLMLSELSGARVEWKSGQSLRITHLTYAHASLMRFALSNWLPNSNKIVKDVAYSHKTLEPPLTGTIFQPSKYFDGAFSKSPKAGVAAAAGASLSSAPTDVHEVKHEVQQVNNRLAAMEEVQQEMSKQLSSLIKLYGA
ncbi:uncharacterized protein LOC133034513 [Cannabis sativa]|uniref:uncharacterized protein LOC133034513 n=1 Tax=Cannabis sativa TaxID=3483 RepID=UPI0029C9E4CC|nr:uncharacterized protein LOC133034513 [Cannabis sativa]